MKPLHTAFLCALLIGSSLQSGRAVTLLLDFEAASGDRQAQFGSGNRTGSSSVAYDNTSTTTGQFFVQSGSLKYQINSSYTGNSSWVVLDDAQPTVVNSTRPDGYTDFLLGSSMVIRSRMSTLTSGVANTAASGGILVGLSDSGSSDSGLFFGIQNNVNGAGSDYLRLSNFSSGAVGTEINASSFEFGSSSTPYFMQLTLTPNVDGLSTNYSFELFSDSSISGSGGDANRLLSGDFGTAVALVSLTGTLSSTQYTSGYVAMAFSSASTNTGGQVMYDNFYIDATAVPEPAVVYSLSLAFLAYLLRRSPRRVG